VPVKIKVLVCDYYKAIERSLPSHSDVARATALDTVGSSDISVTGISIITKRAYENGKKYLLKLIIDESQGNTSAFGICAEVTRSIPGRENNMYLVGMRFFGQTKSMNEYLSKYVMTQQQQQIKQKKFIDGK